MGYHKLVINAILGALSCASNIVFAQNPLVLGNKRITVITPTLFRLDYAQNQKFPDLPTMFARERGNKLGKGVTVTTLDGGKQYQIKTDCFRLLVNNDDLPFGGINTWIFFKRNGEEKKITGRNLHSKTENLNLGGSIPTFDTVYKETPTNDGLLSSDGWYYIVETGTDILKDDWLPARDRDHVLYQYCFIYCDDWYDFFTDEKHVGGEIKDIEEDIYTFPVFVKGGYVLPMQPYNRRPTSCELKTLVMRVYPGKDGDVNTFTLYEDDGVSRDYEKGEYAKTTLAYTQNGKRAVLLLIQRKEVTRDRYLNILNDLRSAVLDQNAAISISHHV